MENLKINANLKRLDTFLSLKEDWNGYGAPAFRKLLIDIAKSVVQNLICQPEIFPIAGGTIQFEYEKPSGEYLEFELYENKHAHCFRIFGDGTEQEEDVCVENMNTVVREFYGLSSFEKRTK